MFVSDEQIILLSSDICCVKSGIACDTFSISYVLSSFNSSFIIF
jgi:hypothetical protein